MAYNIHVYHSYRNSNYTQEKLLGMKNGVGNVLEKEVR